MAVRKRLFCWGILCLLTVAAIPESGVAAVQGSSMQRRGAPAASAFSTATTSSYLIGPGDLLELVLLDPSAKQLGGQVEVLNDGSISLPLLGSVVVNGLSIGQASRLLSQQYRQHLLRPDLTLRVVRPRPIQVSVVGEVQSPGLYSLTSNEVSLINGAEVSSLNGLPRVVTAIQKAGGITLNAGLSQVILRRRIEGTSSGTKDVPLDLLSLLQTGDQSQNPFLFDGDSIVVPRSETTSDQAAELAAANLSPRVITVNVVGEVVKPGRLEVRANTSVMDAILAAGGPKAWRANKSNIELIRLNRDNTVTHQMFRIDYGQPLSSVRNPPLKDGDTLIVQRSLFAATSDAIGAVTDPLVGLVNIWALVDLINNPNR